jgi:hypothetical protein
VGLKLRNRFSVWAAFLSALVLGSAAAAPAAGLRLGTARVEITPPVGYAMQGYEAARVFRPEFTTRSGREFWW